jgi:hypothetical protein
VAPEVQVKADEAKAKSVHQKCRYLIGIYMKVELKPSEYAMCCYLSAMRTLVNTQSGVSEKKMGSDDGYKIGVDGLVAEIAFCKHFNIFPDLSFDPRGGGHDCIFHNRRVDIKSTKPGRTTVYLPERKKHNKIDMYVWCYVDFRSVEILGYFFPLDLFKPENLGQSPRPDELHYKVNLQNIRKFRGE